MLAGGARGDGPRVTTYPAFKTLDQQTQEDLLTIEKSFDTPDAISAHLALLRLKGRVPLTPEGRALLADLRRRVDELLAQQGAVIEPTHILLTKPNTKLPHWRKAQEKVKYKIDTDQAKTGITVYVLRLERPDPLERVGVVLPANHMMSRDAAGMRRLDNYRDGESILFCRDTPGTIGPIQVSSIMHQSMTFESSVAARGVDYRAEICLLATPRTSTGTLRLRLQPEPGLSPVGGFLALGRSRVRLLDAAPIEADGEVVVSRINPGIYGFYVGKFREFSTEYYNSEIKPGEETTVDMKVFYCRLVTLDWKFRNPAGSGDWKTGQCKIFTGDSAHINHWGQNASVYNLGTWGENGCRIYGMDARILEAKPRHFEKSEIEWKKARFERLGNKPLMVTPGAVYALRYGKDMVGEALLRVSEITPVNAVAGSRPAPQADDHN